MDESDKFLIGKELGKFTTNPNGSNPIIQISLEAIQEKINKLEVNGFHLTNFQASLFVFLHEFSHAKQFKDGEVTAAEINDPIFKESEKCKQLEKQADETAFNFIEMYRLAFDKSSLQILANKFKEVPKVGDLVQLNKDIELVETVYFSDQFCVGQGISEDAVDMGQYKVSVSKGSQARINAITGGRVSLVDLSSVGVISAFDYIRGKNIRNNVIINSCIVDLQVVEKVD